MHLVENESAHIEEEQVELGFALVCSFFPDSKLCSQQAMAYIQGGDVRQRRSPWRLSIISEIVLGLLNLIVAFFTTMFSLDAHTNYGRKSDSGRPGYYGSGGPGGPGGNGPGGPPSGFGRGPGQGGAPRGLGNVRGIDHNAPAPCGSCCAG